MSHQLLLFDAVDRELASMSDEPHPFMMTGRELSPGLTDQPVTPLQLRARLLHPSCSHDIRDAVLNELIARAKTGVAPWPLLVVGMLLPGLRRATWPLTTACPFRTEDIQADVLTGLIAAIPTVPEGRARLAAHLTWKARRNAERLVAFELSGIERAGHEPVTQAVTDLPGHPDVVLARAVTAGVIDRVDAELIGATRLGELTLHAAADGLGIGYDAACKRRRRAELVLVAWLTTDDPGFVHDTGSRRGSSGVGRPRQGRRPQ